MKKNILLIIMFITLFFTGSNNVFAQLECKVGEENCNEENIIKDINKKYSGSKLVCLYEVKTTNDEKYYNYIFLSGTNDMFYGGSTVKKNDYGFIPLSTKSDQSIILGSAYDGLYKNNKCPANSYILLERKYDESYTSNAFCFDNDGECKKKFKYESDAIYINQTVNSQSKKTSGENDLSLKSITYENICQNSNLPSGYNKACRYLDPKTGRTAVLLSTSNGSKIIYDEIYVGSKFIIDNNAPMRILQSSKVSPSINRYTYYEYVNNIKSPINTCPSSIYLNKKGFDIDTDGIDENTIYNFSWDLDGSSNMSEFVISKCDEEGGPSTDYDCGKLIDDDLREIINDIMGIIRIAVPIMLIGLLSYDVAMAVLSGADDKVRKARDKAIKRIIIAVAIFFIPTFINLVFDLVNDVWGTNYEICGLEENK